MFVLLPHQLVFAFRGEALLAESDHRGVHDVTEAFRAAGIWMEPHLDANGEKIARLSSWFTASCVLLTAEIILWTVSLASYADPMAATAPKPPTPTPPAQLPPTAPPGFAIPEKRGGLFGARK